MLAECPSPNPAILLIPRGLEDVMLGITTVGSLDGISILGFEHPTSNLTKKLQVLQAGETVRS